MSAVDRIAADAASAAELMSDDLARQGRANTLVLETLREAVARAEAGDVVGVAVVTVTAAGAVGTSFSAADGGFPLVGGLEVVKRRLLAWLDEGSG